ncbi:MAG: hypothetical protein V1746_04535 [bacterium]
MRANFIDETRNVMDKELFKGEQILWAGQPETSVLFTKIDLFLVPFSFLWCGLAFAWELGVLIFVKETAPLVIFGLFGIPFVLIGLYVTFGRFFWKNAKKRRTYYAVTNKRVLVLTNVFNRRVQAEFIDRIPTINKSVRPDGIGTIRFGVLPSIATIAYENTGMDFSTPLYEQNVPTFHDVKNAESVYNMVNEMRNTIHEK